MAYDTHLIRRIGAVHAIIGTSFELGGLIVDAHHGMEADNVEVLMDEFRSQLRLLVDKLEPLTKPASIVEMSAFRGGNHDDPLPF